MTVGMPIYNAQATIEAVLEALLNQTVRNFELIISDNASTDKTREICEKYAATDDRIRYVRQANNIGAEANFNFVLSQSAHKYFMWAAADDIRSLDFLEYNIAFLENNPEYVASTSPVRFEGREFDPKKMGDRSLEDDFFAVRLIDFFRPWHANGAFYSVIRSSVIERCTLFERYLGADWAVVLYLAKQGKLKRLEVGWLVLGLNGASTGNSDRLFRNYRKGILDGLMPFWKLTHVALVLAQEAPLASKAHIFWECIRLNVQALHMQLVSKLYRSYRYLRDSR